MDLLKKMFTVNGQFSWRKGMTALTSIVFAYSCVGYLYGLPELPNSYLGIIVLVFTFYFTKDFLRKMKITNKE